MVRDAGRKGMAHRSRKGPKQPALAAHRHRHRRIERVFQSVRAVHVPTRENHRAAEERRSPLCSKETWSRGCARRLASPAGAQVRQGAGRSHTILLRNFRLQVVRTRCQGRERLARPLASSQSGRGSPRPRRSAAPLAPNPIQPTLRRLSRIRRERVLLKRHGAAARE
jgi:hypothetical protein